MLDADQFGADGTISTVPFDDVPFRFERNNTTVRKVDCQATKLRFIFAEMLVQRAAIRSQLVNQPIEHDAPLIDENRPLRHGANLLHDVRR